MASGAVRELITSIKFRLDTASVNQANRAIDRLKQKLRGLGQGTQSIKIGVNQASINQALSRIRSQLSNLNLNMRANVSNMTIRAAKVNLYGRINNRGGGAGGGGGHGGSSGAGGSGFGGDFMGAFGFGGMSAGMAAGMGVAALGAAAVAATKKYADFDATMSKVRALTGATGKDMEKLTETAQQLGATTKYSATEAAEAMTYLGMAGWKTSEITKGMPGLLNLAAASGMDLATTADIVSDDLTAFHMSADQAGHMADVMAAASTNANTNVGLMGSTFKYAGAVAGTLGYSLEDVALATGLMANAGIKGEMAGTALRSVMTRMIDPPKDAANALAQLGVSATNADGSVKPFRQQLKELRKAFAGLSKAEQAEAASSIAGLDAMSGFLSVVTASDADFNKLEHAIDNSAGAADKMAATMNDNLIGSLTELGSVAESVALKFGKIFEPSARKAVNKVKDYISGASKAMSDYEKIMEAHRLANAGNVAELDKYRGENNITQLEEQHGTFMKFLEFWDLYKQKIDDVAEWLSGRLLPIIESFGGYVDKFMGDKWDNVSENMLKGLESLGGAWEALKPTIEVLVNLLSVVLAWAFQEAMLIGSAAFRVISGVIESTAKILGAFGQLVKTVTGWLQDLVNWAVSALEYLGLVESKRGGINASVVDKWFDFGARDGGNSYSSTVNVGTVTVPTADDVGAGISSIGRQETPTFFPKNT